MRKAVFALCLCFVLLLSACGSNPEAAASGSPTPTPTESDALVLGNPGQPSGQASGQASGNTSSQPSGEASASPAASASKSALYDPSIFVIEAEKTWQQELAEGYYANNECEIYLQKIDSNDNRQVVGSYQGMFWMKTTLDTQEYIQDMLGDIPGMEASFDAGGEAVCDNLGISLNTEVDKAWVNYSIMGEDGKPLPLTQDTPVAKGSFVAVSKSVYLDAQANGPQGENVDYSDSSSGDEFDVNFVIHVAPDSAEANGERKVVIHLFGENFDVTMEGVMKRLPGYPEDVSDYLNSAEYEKAAKSHLQE